MSDKRPALFCVREVFLAATAIVEPAHEPTKTGAPLPDRLGHAARSRGDAAPPADFFAAWARRFILFQDRRHPRELGLAHVTHFLEHAAKTEREPLPASGKFASGRGARRPHRPAYATLAAPVVLPDGAHVGTC
jgi:hypothetical protein